MTWQNLTRDGRWQIDPESGTVRLAGPVVHPRQPRTRAKRKPIMRTALGPADHKLADWLQREHPDVHAGIYSLMIGVFPNGFDAETFAAALTVVAQRMKRYKREAAR